MKDLLQSIEGKKAAMLALLERLVNIDSALDNPAGNERCAHIIGDKLVELGFTVEYYSEDRRKACEGFTSEAFRLSKTLLFPVLH